MTPPHEQVRRLIAETATRMSPREREIAQHITRVLAELEWLGPDRQMRDLLEASVSANVAAILHMFRSAIPADTLEPATAAVEYARRLAQRGVPTYALLRAYYTGQDSLLSLFFDEIESLDRPAELKYQVVQQVSATLHSYIDTITVKLLDVYDRERERWSAAQGSVNAALIHQVLTGNEPEAEARLQEQTGYRLPRTHLGAILWTRTLEPTRQDVLALERATEQLRVQLGCRTTPLACPNDRNTMWAWFPLDRANQQVDAESLRASTSLPDGVRVALGLPAEGCAGFRRTHEQAGIARAGALAGQGVDHPIVSYGDPGIAVTSFLAQDMEGTRMWVREMLGGLAAPDEATARLRETLRVYLGTGGNTTYSGELLHLHRNSVRYRVDRAIERRGRPLEDDRLDVELALRTVHLLGEELLADERDAV